ncbi:MAG TPA: hypothetical protein VGZ22_00195 [Isosphaeraceae bacterium]|jgi:hypothetical protein|nr:hypothetical protein [Isosphaeraceae bacterium]
MPHRLVCIAILVFWSLAAGALFTRDVLPDLMIGNPPDLRTITASQTDANSEPTYWTIQVAEDPNLLNRRPVGQAETRSTLTPNGWVHLESKVRIDAGDLLKGTRFDTFHDEQLEVVSTYEINASGNLDSFWTAVKSAEEPGDLLTLEGKVTGDALEVKAKGPLPLFNWTRTLRYQPRGMVQNTLGPVDRMPGLQVGQRWESRIVSPLTGRVETVRFEVARKGTILWGNNPVAALEVVAKGGPMSLRLWVRPDGLVLRQEVPFPFVRLVIERKPDRGTAGPAAADAQVFGP